MTRTRPGRSLPRADLALLLLAACAAPGEGLPLADLPLEGRLALASSGPGLARAAEIAVSIAPTEPMELWVVGERPALQEGDDALLVLNVRYEDFPGEGPVSYGSTISEVVPLGEDGAATAAEPLVRTVTVDLPAPAGVLARRVSVAGRLWPVDIVAAESRWGGRALDLEPAVLETFSEATGRDLAELLEDAGAGGRDLFLAATAVTGEPDRLVVVGRLVERLPALTGAPREAALAALLYLTGARLGREPARWADWWARRSDVP